MLVKIKAVVEEVERAESLLDIGNLKKLRAEGSYYRVRVSDYRIGFTEDEGVITFIRVLHRREMYQYFP